MIKIFVLFFIDTVCSDRKTYVNSDVFHEKEKNNEFWEITKFEKKKIEVSSQQIVEYKLLGYIRENEIYFMNS